MNHNSIYAKKEYMHTCMYKKEFIHACSVTKSCPSLCDPLCHSLQALLSMGFSRQEYWSGLLCSVPGDVSNSGTEPASPVIQVDSLLLSHLRRY